MQRIWGDIWPGLKLSQDACSGLRFLRLRQLEYLCQGSLFGWLHLNFSYWLALHAGSPCRHPLHPGPLTPCPPASWPGRMSSPWFRTVPQGWGRSSRKPQSASCILMHGKGAVVGKLVKCFKSPDSSLAQQMVAFPSFQGHDLSSLHPVPASTQAGPEASQNL